MPENVARLAESNAQPISTINIVSVVPYVLDRDLTITTGNSAVIQGPITAVSYSLTVEPFAMLRVL